MNPRQLCAVTAVVLLASASCSKSAEDCSYTASCGVDAVGKIDSGTLCNPACSGATPVCDESAGKCVGGTVAACHACVADSECASSARGPSARCVAMNFRGAPHGSYCLNLASAGSCVQPFTVSLTAASVSGAQAEAYCGISQDATTCEAVVDLIAGKACTRSTNCGSGQNDGLCENFGSTSAQSMRCSIPCTSSSQCSQSQTCTSGVTSYCR